MYSVVNFEQFVRAMDIVQPFPFYGVLLYSRSGLWYDQLHEYVVTHWHDLHELTGKALLLGVVEDVAQERRTSNEGFRPEDVHVIARYMRVPAENLPCLAFFTDPKSRQVMRIVRLGRPGTSVPFGTTEDSVRTALSNFFSMIADFTYECADHPTGAERFDCLCGRLDRRWPDEKGSTVTVDRRTTVFAAVRAAYFLAKETRDWLDVILA